VTELGTEDHPYKDINSVMIELLNYHSHSDREINVYLKEGSTNFLFKETHIINITQVNFFIDFEK
jgi:hypothetical protein